MYLANRHRGRVGGVGLTVEVDESVIFRRKNHQGRILRSEAATQWIVGGICRETKATFFTLVGDRSSVSIRALLREYVNEGSIVITDFWRGYDGIEDLGFVHKKVNHSENFVAPDDSAVYTQTIERLWRTIKANIPKGSRYRYRLQYATVATFKHEVGWYSMSCSERFELLLSIIKENY